MGSRYGRGSPLRNSLASTNGRDLNITPNRVLVCADRGGMRSRYSGGSPLGDSLASTNSCDLNITPDATIVGFSFSRLVCRRSCCRPLRNSLTITDRRIWDNGHGGVLCGPGALSATSCGRDVRITPDWIRAARADIVGLCRGRCDSHIAAPVQPARSSLCCRSEGGNSCKFLHHDDKGWLMFRVVCWIARR